MSALGHSGHVQCISRGPLGANNGHRSVHLLDVGQLPRFVEQRVFGTVHTE